MSETSALTVANHFKLNVMKLIDFLIDILNSDSDLLATRLIVKLIPDKTAIENFAKDVENNTHVRREIETKNESYFLDGDGSILFMGIDQSKVIKFKNFWKQISHEQRECIWKYFAYFLKLSDRYTELISKQ